jgi:hypothetical protein
MKERLTSTRSPAAVPARALRPDPVLDRRHSFGSNACVQRQAKDGGMEAQPALREVLASPGRPLDAEARALMEPRFERDFSHVRIHADETAAKSARGLGASAFTVGPHIAFDSAQYAPQSAKGQAVLAHELAHVVQQTGAGTPAPDALKPIRIGDPADGFERAADSSARVALGTHPSVSASALALAGGSLKGEALTVQRLPSPAPQQQEQVETRKPHAAPLELWNHLEPILDQELVNTYLEMGPIAARHISEQVSDFFDPYEEQKTNQTFQDILNIAAGGGGNALQDTLTPYASLSGGIGGAVAQFAQVLLAHTLTTNDVEEAKKRIAGGVSELEDTEFTRSSPTFMSFEKEAMNKLEGEVAEYWSWYDKIGLGVTQPDILVVTQEFRDRVRKEYGVASKAGQKILAEIRKAVKAYLEPLRPQLEAAIRNQQSKRTGYATLGAFLGGGLIGTAIGAGASKGSVGWAAIGGLIGGVGAAGLTAAASAIRNAVANKSRAKEIREKQEKEKQQNAKKDEKPDEKPGEKNDEKQ